MVKKKVVFMITLKYKIFDDKKLVSIPYMIIKQYEEFVAPISAELIEGIIMMFGGNENNCNKTLSKYVCLGLSEEISIQESISA